MYNDETGQKEYIAPTSFAFILTMLPLALVANAYDAIRRTTRVAGWGIWRSTWPHLNTLKCEQRRSDTIGMVWAGTQ